MLYQLVLYTFPTDMTLKAEKNGASWKPSLEPAGHRLDSGYCESRLGHYSVARELIMDYPEKEGIACRRAGTALVAWMRCLQFLLNYNDDIMIRCLVSKVMFVFIDIRQLSTSDWSLQLQAHERREPAFFNMLTRAIGTPNSCVVDYESFTLLKSVDEKGCRCFKEF